MSAKQIVFPFDIPIITIELQNSVNVMGKCVFISHGAYQGKKRMHCNLKS